MTLEQRTAGKLLSVGILLSIFINECLNNCSVLKQILRTDSLGKMSPPWVFACMREFSVNSALV